MSATNVQNKNILRIAFATAFLLLVPFVAMQYSENVVWSGFDFVVAGALLFGAGLTFELISRRRSGLAYKVGVAATVGTGLFLIWANLAVGLIGNEGNPANLMYFAVLAVAIVGVLIARFQPRGMSRALFATALAQMLVAVIAQIAGLGPTYMVNGFFAVLWIGSGLILQRAAQEQE